ncbi:MAG TPA: peptidoglycan-binding domain-containing protein [Desertimonas sp.]|nr:peptidoglycan-binding domain-containing protein [Desertimonas sp.]
MNPELERRLKRSGAVVDGATDAAAADHRASATAGSGSAVADLDNVVDLTPRPHRLYRALAVAAAALILVVGGIAIAAARRSPSTSVGDQPFASARPVVTDGSAPATTERSDLAPSPTTSAVPAPPPPTNQTMPPVCQSYTVHNDYHLEICDRGPAVRLVQERLRTAVDSSLNVDGYFGPDTRNAVRTFQQMHQLTVDGQVGPATWEVLVPDAPGTDADGNGVVDPHEISAD